MKPLEEHSEYTLRKLNKYADFFLYALGFLMAVGLALQVYALYQQQEQFEQYKADVQERRVQLCKQGVLKNQEYCALVLKNPYTDGLPRELMPKENK